MENSENQNFTQIPEKSNLEVKISSIINLFNNRDKELWTIITKYDELRREMQQTLKLEELSTNEPKNPIVHLKRQHYMSNVTDIFNYMDKKVEKFKSFIISKNEKTMERLIRFQEKQKMNEFQMTTHRFSFDEDESEMIFDFEIQSSDEMTNNSTIVNFIPNINSTNAPVNPTNSSAKASLNSPTSFQAPASPNNLQTNEIDENRADTDVESENDDEIECKTNETVAANLKPTHNNINNKKFECEICKKFYSNQKSLRIHKYFYHSKHSFECEICNKKFKRKEFLRKHKKTHDTNRPKPLKCQQCDYATDYKQEISRHEKFHERQNTKFALMKNPVKCEKCPTICKNKKALWNHMIAVHPKVLYQCDLCGIKMKTKTNLKIHILRHMRK